MKKDLVTFLTTPEKKTAPRGPDGNISAIVANIAHKAGGVGMGAADLNGVIEDLGTMSAKQAETFKTLMHEIEAMVKANRAIGDVTTASHESVRRARQTVENLGQGVTGVLDTLHQVSGAAVEITQIALQTRLVAFNASIEAQHAGQAGRGFAIVAEAVRDLAARVEKSSKLIVSAVSQLDERVRELAHGIQSKEAAQDSGAGKETFHAAVSEVERGVEHIAAAAKENLAGCAGVLESVRGLTQQVETTARTLQTARKRTEVFLDLSEALIEMTAESGIETEDSPYIAMIQDNGTLISQMFEEAIANRVISAAELFDEQYRPIQGSNPPQFITRFTAFTDRLLPDILEKGLAFSHKVVYVVAVDRNGYLPTHNRKYSKPQTNDPIWNLANCRNHRMFNKSRTERAVMRSRAKFLLQTYRRDMGGGNFVIMKDLSAPIWVAAKYWGAVRIGYQC